MVKDILDKALEICAEYEDIDANGNANDWMRVSMLITEALQVAASDRELAKRMAKRRRQFEALCAQVRDPQADRGCNHEA